MRLSVAVVVHKLSHVGVIHLGCRLCVICEDQFCCCSGLFLLCCVHFCDGENSVPVGSVGASLLQFSLPFLVCLLSVLVGLSVSCCVFFE